MLPLRGQDPERIADYRLIGRLGEGGMGVVYLARSPRGRMVAVKTIRAELAAASDFRRRFARETAAAQRVGGEWTAAVLAADPDAAQPWVATAYIAGPTLHQVVAEQHGPLPEHSVRALAAGLSEALGDIHAAGLVHRDLKPSNVLVSIAGPRVIDFGIVRALDVSGTGGLTSTGMVVGSPGFMSPEQIRGERLTEASDVFSLGTVLAFATTGRLAFGAPEGQPHALMYRVVNDPPDLTGVPGPLRELIRDCLAKEPADRPTLAELREREETRYRSSAPWLPPELLARLGQDAVRLLAHEDPGPRTGPATGASADVEPATATAAAPTEPARPPTAPFTAPSADGPPHQQTVEPDREERPGRPGRRGAGDRSWGDASPVVLCSLLALFAVASALTAVLGAYLAGGAGVGKYVSDENEVRTQVIEDPARVLGSAQILVGVALMVCWLIWFARMRVAAERLAPGRLRYVPHMAVLGWFIPVGNLFLPKQIANDIWHASSPPGRGDGTTPAGPPSAWWVLWLVVLLPWPFFWVPWTETVNGYAHYYDLNASTWIKLVLQVLAVPAAVVTARYVRRLTAMQAARAALGTGGSAWSSTP